MKRAIFILIAALLVLLVYPSTHPYAKSRDAVMDGPIVVTPPTGELPIVLSDSDDDDSDDGDADGLTGSRGGHTKPGGSSRAAEGLSNVVLTLKMWWKYVIWVR
jgi:hypothetical protein